MAADRESDEFLSDLYHSLRATRRRDVIRLLLNSPDQTLTVRELAREIAALEHQLPQSHATGEPYRNAYNALSQTHLPTLSSVNIVIYDPQRQRVSQGPNFTIAALLVAIDESAVRSLTESLFTRGLNMNSSNEP
jgi:hypothetical protein